jgi:hypothetical protein
LQGSFHPSTINSNSDETAGKIYPGVGAARLLREGDRLAAGSLLCTDAQGIQKLQLNYSVNNLNENPAPVSEANVIISNEDSAWQLTEKPKYSGRYVTSPGFVAIPGKSYTLLISHNAKIYSAKSQMEAGRLFDPLQYLKNDGDSLFHIDWVASAFSGEFPAMWEILLDWSNVPVYNGLDSTLNTARLLFYTLPTLDVGQIFAPPVEKVFFPKGTVITERRYSLTPEHAGLFSSVPANVTTNLSSGAIGWFGACGRTSLSLVVAQ